MKIEKDATVGDVLPAVWNRDKFMGRIFCNLANCSAKNGNAFVRIGVTGTGNSPNHKVTFDVGGLERTFGAFDTWSRTNEWFDDQKSGTNWSSARTSFDEFKAVFKKHLESSAEQT